MIVRIEPKDWNMQTVLLYFDKNEPHTEDDAVREYLTARKLEPRRQYDETLDDTDFSVMSFGGCYLGKNHLDALADIQRNIVQREMLADRIIESLTEGNNEDVKARTLGLENDELSDVVIELLDEYDDDSAYIIDENGHLTIAIDDDALHASFMGIMAR